MEMTPLLLLLSSGFFHSTLTSSHLRGFNRSRTDSFSFTSSKQKCAMTQSTPVTVYDDDDEKLISHICFDRSCWLGLRRRNQGTVATWSNNVSFTFNASIVSLGVREQKCEAIANKTWIGFDCSDKKSFMCYNKKNSYIRVDKRMDWCEARRYCRTHHTDLVSISNQTQNQEVISKGKNKTFWIGLLHDEWEWDDGGCSTSRSFQPGYPAEADNNCVAVRGSKWKQWSCTNIAYSLCSKGSMKIKVINQKLTWEQAFDYCKENHKSLLWIKDDRDQNITEQWLEQLNVSGPLWLGLTQSRLLGFWIWANDKVVGRYTNWKDDRKPELPQSHHCGAISKEDNFKWSDKDCRLQLPFLCEKEV